MKGAPDCPRCSWAMLPSGLVPGSFFCCGDNCPDMAKVKTLEEIRQEHAAKRKEVA